LALSRFLPPEERSEEDLALFDRDAVSERYLEWVRSLMTTYGYKTKRELFKDMKNCSIECRNGTIIIGPSCHDRLEGWSGDGIRQEDHVVIRADGPVADVGAALRLAFARCI